MNHPMNGIFLHPNIDKNVWQAGDNAVVDNVIVGSGLADITMTGPSMSGNCFSDNDIETTMPPGLETRQGCDGLRVASLYQLGSLSSLFGRLIEHELGLFDDVPYADLPHPPPQEQMPGGADAPVLPAVNVFASAEPDLSAVSLPALPAGLQVTQEKGFDLMGVTFASTIGGFIGLYAYVLPLVLYAAWVVIAIWEIVARREDLSRGAGVRWILVILIVPFLGVIAYYVMGRSTIPAAYRWVLLAGGLGAYLLLLVLGLFLGGIV